MLSLCKSHSEQRGFAWCWIQDSAAARPGDLGGESAWGEIPVLGVQSRAGAVQGARKHGSRAGRAGALHEFLDTVPASHRNPQMLMVLPASSTPQAVWDEGFASEPGGAEPPTPAASRGRDCPQCVSKVYGEARKSEQMQSEMTAREGWSTRHNRRAGLGEGQRTGLC